MWFKILLINCFQYDSFSSEEHDVCKIISLLFVREKVNYSVCICFCRFHKSKCFPLFIKFYVERNEHFATKLLLFHRDFPEYVMIVTYIFHSGYVIETERFSIVFDFYKDAKKSDGTYFVRDYLLKKPEDLYVFCSHSHPDHFNPEILSWKEKKNNITYIFANELLESKQTIGTGVHYLAKYAKFEDYNLWAQLFGSTDLGGSFLVNVNDKLIFHAGDLNNWHWKEEVSKEEALVFENNYLCELELLAENVNHLYLAMFPIDPRLGKEYMRGAEQFVNRIPTEYLLPMHFGEQYAKVNAFENIARQNNCNYLKVTHTGQSFEL